MSLESWLEEFYPIPADKSTREGAVEHSLQKWIGLRKENLDKHECSVTGPAHKEHARVVSKDLERIGYLLISSNTCSLCYHYYNDSPPDEENYCSACPLYQSLGMACDAASWDGTEIGPFARWYYSNGNDLEPMIKALEEIKRDTLSLPVLENKPTSEN